MMNGRSNLVFRSSFIIPHPSFPHMSKFNFKLQAVLRQRELIEQECQRDFAIARATHLADQAELKKLDETVRVAVADLRENRLVGQIDLSFLAAHRRFMADMQRRGVAQIQKVEAARKVMEEVRIRLAEASKQKKIIEKLKEKQLAEWTAAAAAKETAAMDEIAMQMSTMTMREHWNGDESPAGEPENQL
jgi:flagellar FliJ protein